ncbi:MAG TPA: alcohol dehydrogenase catalytic domain-containing protein [Acidothermaceae bacterium]|jgi:L-iditol 2-dehydrogenase
MQAVVLRERGSLEVSDVDEPVLAPGGIVVASAYAGVCGSDVRSWRHGSPRLKGPQVLGHEVSGRIVATDAPDLPVGTRVAVCPGVSCQRCEMCQRGGAIWCPYRVALGYDFPGGMAERFAVPARAIEIGCAVVVPDSLSLRAAALAEPLHTVLNGQERARVHADDSVLVVGLGPIGTLHTAVARSRGAAPVLGIDVLQERVSAAAAVLGSDAVSMSPGDVATVRKLAPRGGWDVVILASNSPSAFELAFGAAAPGGRILAFAGMPPASSTVPVDLNRVHYQQLEIIGAFGGNPEYFRAAVRWLERATIDSDHLVTTTVPLAEATTAFDLCERGEGLKTAISINP